MNSDVVAEVSEGKSDESIEQVAQAKSTRVLALRERLCFGVFRGFQVAVPAIF